MKIDGHDLGNHIRLLAPLFAFIAAVWALRLVLFAAGAPMGVVRVSSVTVAGAISVLFAALLIHVRRFGSYTSVVLAVFLLECCQQILIVVAIAFGALTNIEVVYARPEFSFGADPLHHIIGQLTFGVGFWTLSGSAMGSLVLWMLRRFTPKEARS